MPKRTAHNIYLIIIFTLLQGCTSIYARITYDFNKSEQDNRVFYETGAEDLASEISADLNRYISTVEKKQDQSFMSPDELKVYVFSDKNRYARFSSSTPLARGSATTNEIYISPIINNRRHTLPAIMIHELSHVHLRQYIGTWRYWTEIPGWFLEGLAVEVSEGGGAEKVSDEQAKKLIRSGTYFVPREQSNIWGHNSAHNYKLKPQVYYRQANLFVRYLKDINPEAFKRTYLSLIQGIEFSDAWESHYHKSIPSLWQEYLTSIQSS